MIVGRRRTVVRAFSQVHADQMHERFANETRVEKERITLRRKIFLVMLLLFILAVF